MSAKLGSGPVTQTIKPVPCPGVVFKLVEGTCVTALRDGSAELNGGIKCRKPGCDDLWKDFLVKILYLGSRMFHVRLGCQLMSF